MAGAEVVYALNHSPLAIQVHNENHPNTAHLRAEGAGSHYKLEFLRTNRNRPGVRCSGSSRFVSLRAVLQIVRQNAKVLPTTALDRAKVALIGGEDIETSVALGQHDARGIG